jgi:hypothetical protein
LTNDTNASSILNPFLVSTLSALSHQTLPLGLEADVRSRRSESSILGFEPEFSAS